MTQKHDRAADRIDPTNPKVAIVMARCSHSKQSFGIRLEEKISGNWLADWAFPLKESTAKKEGYYNNQIIGSFSIDPAYPGCVYCERKNFCLCSGSQLSPCNKVGCAGEQESNYTCPWCGAKSKIEGLIQSLDSGTDR
jgi:hypothetical protein